MGYQETPLTLIELALFILMVEDCLCACTRHNQYTLMGLTSLAESFLYYESNHVTKDLRTHGNALPLPRVLDAGGHLARPSE